MNTFEQLLKQAQTVADRRTKVFNELKKEFNNVIIPQVKEVMKKMEETELILDSSTPFYQDQSAFNEDCDQYSVTVDFDDLTYASNDMNMKYELYVPNNSKWHDISEVKNVNLLVFIKQIEISLKSLVREAHMYNEDANNILKK